MKTSFTAENRFTKIKLGENINSEIRREGFKPGDVVDAEISRRGAAWFASELTGNDCVVYPDDYTEEIPTPAAPKKDPLKSKGAFLDRIFSHVDELNLSKKMVSLFIDNGLDRMDLTELGNINPAAQKQWFRYHRRNNRISAFITYTVLGK
jgi:hypothetical protein